MTLLDTVLDRSVVGGFSRLGIKLRRSSWDDADPAPDALSGRTVVVTGATSGIGAEVAAAVAGLGGHAVLVGRNRERADRARSDIASRFPGAQLSVETGDVSDPDEVVDLAARLAALGGVDVLVHNAGVLPKQRQESAGGDEVALATHVLGPIQLTELLLPELAASPDPRVIFMSSGGMYTAPLPVGDIQFRRGEYNGTRAYARTKRLQVALLGKMAQRWRPSGVMVAGMHPGWVKTGGLTDALPGFARLTGPLLRTAAEGADTAVWLAATQPTPPTGKFWSDRAIRPEHFLRRTRFSEADRDAVWQAVLDASRIES